MTPLEELCEECKHICLCRECRGNKDHKDFCSDVQCLMDEQSETCISFIGTDNEDS